MAKILIINIHNHNHIGGAERYSKNLIEFMCKFDLSIDEFDVIPEPLQDEKVNLRIIENDFKDQLVFNNFKKFHKHNIFYSFYIYILTRRRIRKTVYKLEKNNNYDLIIDNTFFYYKKFNKLDKYIWVQHNSPSYYRGDITKSAFLNSISKYVLPISGVRNPFKNIKNVIMYDQFNENVIKKNKSNNYFTIPLAMYSSAEIKKNSLVCENSLEKPLLNYGRYENHQKNLVLLNEILSNVKKTSFVYGYGPDKHLIKGKKINLNDKIDQNNLGKIFNNSSFFILTSNFEGFGYVLVESLSHGVPILVRDSFPSAKFLTNNNKNGFLFSKKSSAPEVVDFINKSIAEMNEDSYKVMRNNCTDFAVANLAIEAFEHKWIEILKIKKII